MKMDLAAGSWFLCGVNMFVTPGTRELLKSRFSEMRPDTHMGASKARYSSKIKSTENFTQQFVVLSLILCTLVEKGTSSEQAPPWINFTQHSTSATLVNGLRRTQKIRRWFRASNKKYEF